MGFVWMVARRYLKTKRGHIFKFVITIISIGGVFVGVAALLVVLSVMNGFQKDLRDKILGVNAHIILLRFYNEPFGGYDTLMVKLKEMEEEIIGASPFVYSKVMVSHDSYVDGVVMRGVDLATLGEVSDIGERVVLGSMELEGEGLPGAVMGVTLADRLRIFVGDTVTIALPFGVRRTPMGSIPRFARFVVKGLFDAGMYEYNASLVLIPLKSAQRLLGIGDKVTGIEIKIKDLYDAPVVAKRLEETIGFPYRTNDWVHLNRNLFAALKLEKITMFIILTLIVLVAAFNIVSTLIMIVMEKTREIGILKSMGATPGMIAKIFIVEGLVIGIIGTVLGEIGGYTISWALAKYRFISIPGDVYFLDKLPVSMELWDFVIVGVCAVLISFLATVYPAIRAAKLDPVEAIRYE